MWADGPVALCAVPDPTPIQGNEPQLFVEEHGALAVLFAGHLYNLREIEASVTAGGTPPIRSAAEALARGYASDPTGFLDRLNGRFAFALWDSRSQRLLLGRDRLGIEPLFYQAGPDCLRFGSSLAALARTGGDFHPPAILQYLLYCYNPAPETVIGGVRKLPAAHLLRFDSSGLQLQRYWRLSFLTPEEKTEPEYREAILSLVADAVRIRLDGGGAPGIFLSGGTDSSALVSVCTSLTGEPVRTFSFRCRWRSYDESSYARFVAERYGSVHTEISYGPEDLALIDQAVRWMDEPFCDLGIEIGTHLLGRAATGSVGYVLSGEGGDELFAGHPVYTADKVAAVVDHLPAALVRPLARALQRLPDSDRKKTLPVMLKRFAYSLAFPPELLSHRWRVYYTRDELRALCHGDFLAACDPEHMFEPLLRIHREADGRDRLSRSLFSDYQTLVDFYLRRLGLLRAFSLESRVPLMDHRLVEHTAAIPSRWKLRGFSGAKYIYKKALEPILPAEILYDRPKLGHGVPMKNWLREDAVRRWTEERLSDGALARTGLFRPGVIRRMLDEHTRKTHNHSHRLWGLIVLGAWLDARAEAA
jgi:asparagine synthase (glutamine-hydrolysing)